MQRGGILLEVGNQGIWSHGSPCTDVWKAREQPMKAYSSLSLSSNITQKTRENTLKSVDKGRLVLLIFIECCLA